MINIIKSDLYRILRGKAIYIVTIVIILLSIISCVGMTPGNIGVTIGADTNSEMLQKLSQSKSIGEYREIIKSYKTFPLDKEILGSNVNLYYFFIVIVVIVLTTDFSNKSAKNTLSSAITRKKYYFSKLALILGLSTMLVLINNYGTYFLNIAINGEQFASSFMEITKLTLMQFPLLYGIISLLVCLGFVLKKTSLFNTVSIPFISVIQLVGMAIINLFRIKADWFYEYEIQFALAKLVSNPTKEYVIHTVILGIVYIVVFNIMGYNVFRKTEIK